MTLDTLHPRTPAEVAEIVRDASAAGRSLLPVGGRAHADRGNPVAPDAELWTTQLDEIVSYEPAEMLVVVQAGMRCGELAARLAEHDQGWPVDAPEHATVGGVIAAGVSSFRRLRVGNIRDSVVEMTFVTGDGRTITSGAPTVKNVSGFDLHRLLTGSLGTLGVIVEVALKVRPLPRASRLVRASDPGDDPAALADRLARTIPGPAAAVVASPGAIDIHLEGWPGEVDDQLASARTVVAVEDVDDPAPARVLPAFADHRIVAEVAVAPSRVPAVLEGETVWQSLGGVGLGWVGVDDLDRLEALRRRAAAAGGIAPVMHGPGGLGEASPPALEIHRRLKAAFDPAGVLAPGRSWGGL